MSSLTVLSGLAFAYELANPVVNCFVLGIFQEKLVDVLISDDLLLLSCGLALSVETAAEVQQSRELLRGFELLALIYTIVSSEQETRVLGLGALLPR